MRTARNRIINLSTWRLQFQPDTNIDICFHCVSSSSLAQQYQYNWLREHDIHLSTNKSELKSYPLSLHLQAFVSSRLDSVQTQISTKGESRQLLNIYLLSLRDILKSVIRLVTKHFFSEKNNNEDEKEASKSPHILFSERRSTDCSVIWNSKTEKKLTSFGTNYSNRGYTFWFCDDNCIIISNRSTRKIISTKRNHCAKRETETCSATIAIVLTTSLSEDST